jgi:2-oxo-4-hydroxy-4-carboxy--5-ureidoimidazoline (OHCU) decarboxylase
MAARIDLATIFERAPGLAERLRDREDDGPSAIVRAARQELGRMTEIEHIAVLNAHPRIGASPASLSAHSRREQGATGDPATIAQLERLNDEYERKFGFRFVVFVRGRTHREIIPVLRERLEHTREAELATGIEEFLAITRDRLEKATYA